MSTAKDSKKAKGNGDVAFFRKMTETLETTISTLAEQLKQRDEATTSLIAKLKQSRLTQDALVKESVPSRRPNSSLVHPRSVGAEVSD